LPFIFARRGAILLSVASDQLRVAAPPSKPLMIFDGECRFCGRWIERWRGVTGEDVDYQPFQDAIIAERFPEIPREQFEQAVQLVTPDGTVYSAAEAVLRALAAARRERWLLWLYRKLPVFSILAETIYHEVAVNREFLSKVDRALYGERGELPRYVGVRYIFLRGLALIYLVAFVSLSTQIHGLMGSGGINPAEQTISAVKSVLGQNPAALEKYRVFPTLNWLGASDRSLDWECRAGIVLSLLLLCGIAPAPALFLLWLIYLSLVSIGLPFLNFQWDMLLLETGFLAIFLAPMQWLELPMRQPPPSRIVIWLLRWLIFRLMLESGCVKLMSSDATWWNLSALRVHFETQPLPTWIGWHAHQLPAGILRAITLLMFLIELIGPALVFCGRRFRRVAAAFFVAFQIMILLTGNYTFFNFLTILLCLPLLDDQALEFFWKRKSAALPVMGRARWPSFLTLPLSILVVLATSVPLLSTMGVRPTWSRAATALYVWLEPLRSFNGYGLFSVMTQTRPEIIVEGSDDGENWRAYEFKYKPGDVNKRPGFVAPFQPRLDWQMWFAALGDARENPWFLRLEYRLLQNSPTVTALLATNPFPTNPPKYIRAQLYEYHFTNKAEHKATGAWWTRKYLGVYIPPASLQSFEGIK
jgi:predicted DCC family thiol-disulfide oxidoreductase YuxK